VAHQNRFTRAGARGSALIVALLVLSLAAVVALATARSGAFGLRIATAGQFRLELRSAAENAVERALAAPLPTGESRIGHVEKRGGLEVTTVVTRDRRMPLGSPTTDGYSVGLGGSAFGAEHYFARATAADARGAQATVEQSFQLLVPEGP
jgi:hypothetical protein